MLEEPEIGRQRHLKPVVDWGALSCENGWMILEVAVLDVRATEEEAFETAMRQALPLIKATSGFAELNLRRSIETPNRYLLTVSWETLEDHTVGFRQSGRYQKWRDLLHRFYDPFPVVEHYSEAISL